MLVLSLFVILMAVALSNTAINPILLTRIGSLVLIYAGALSYNALDIQGIGEGISIYSGLFQVTSVSQSVDTFIFVIGAMILLPWAPVTNNLNVRSVFTAVPTITTYPLIILFTTCGASFLISSADLVSIYLSIELQSFAVYILATLYRDSDTATAAGLKYFLLGGLSSALILLGSALVYAYTGLTNLESIFSLLSVEGFNSSIYDMNLCAIGFFIFVVGFLFKISAAPFHNWAPDVYDGTPTIVTTWLTIMPKLSILILLLEVQSGLILGQSFAAWTNLLLVSSLLSLIIGTVVGLAQTRIKRLLTYSTISHVGFLLLALAVNTEESIESFLFYLFQYTITNLNAFMIILAFGYVINSAVARGRNTDLQLIVQLAGQFRSNPILGLSLTVCLFSMAGVPPLVGFFAKQTVLYSATHSGYYFLSIVAILVSVISAYYYLKIVRVIHFDSADSITLTSSAPVEQNISSVHSFSIATLTMIIALFAVYPDLILNSTTLLALTLFGY